LMDSATEEMLRYSAPVMYFRRTATADTTLGGKAIKQGDPLVLWYISANRDETHFASPQEFRVDRTPNEHIAFGGRGPHFCLGANLARSEINKLFVQVLTRLDNLQLAGDVSRLRSNFINGIKHMPVTFDAARKSTG
jgi:cholest-4-en-3-one 26-monooxygenase